MLDDLINEKASKGWELVTWEIFSQLTGIENVARKEPEQGQPLMPRLLPNGRSPTPVFCTYPLKSVKFPSPS